jgi:hypothetical protein
MKVVHCFFLNIYIFYVQFKFVVDGEWRNDEQQPIMTDPAGNCSNYIVVREVESASASRGVGRGNMDVEDGDAHVRILPIKYRL